MGKFFPIMSGNLSSGTTAHESKAVPNRVFKHMPPRASLVPTVLQPGEGSVASVTVQITLFSFRFSGQIEPDVSVWNMSSHFLPSKQKFCYIVYSFGMFFKTIKRFIHLFDCYGFHENTPFWFERIH